MIIIKKGVCTIHPPWKERNTRWIKTRKSHRYYNQSYKEALLFTGSLWLQCAYQMVNLAWYSAGCVERLSWPDVKVYAMANGHWELARRRWYSFGWIRIRYQPHSHSNRPQRITPEHQHMVQYYVSQLNRATGKSHATIFSSLHTAFKVPRYQELPESEWEKIVQWFNTQIPANKQKPTQEKLL